MTKAANDHILDLINRLGLAEASRNLLLTENKRLRRRLALALMELGKAQDPRFDGLEAVTVDKLPKSDRLWTAKPGDLPALTDEQVDRIVGYTPIERDA